ncbi:hypothetical protein ABT404_00415 [Streptomyces hyaluromycini]|uniref:Chitinase n=1 Tax=Streptomyces hyaluromycini TaxID=1377993 RepID=A0ABV1WM70_9ACTN
MPERTTLLLATALTTGLLTALPAATASAAPSGLAGGSKTFTGTTLGGPSGTACFGDVLEG